MLDEQRGRSMKKAAPMKSRVSEPMMGKVGPGSRVLHGVKSEGDILSQRTLADPLPKENRERRRSRMHRQRVYSDEDNELLVRPSFLTFF